MREILPTILIHHHESDSFEVIGATADDELKQWLKAELKLAVVAREGRTC